MNTELQQLRDAVKAVAKARAEGKPIDLSTLPPAIRAKLEAQLSKLPPETRQQLEGRGIAAAEKVAQRVGSVATPGMPHMRTPEMPKYSGHYNKTIQAGDATRVPWTWLFAVVLGGWALWRFAS